MTNPFLNLKYPFHLEKCKTSSEACEVSKTWYDNYCPFSEEHKSVINENGLYLTGSHILKAGQTQFEKLSKYPISVLPMREDFHAQYETLGPHDRFLWICENANKSKYKQMIKIQLEMFVRLMIEKGINPEVFCGK